MCRVGSERHVKKIFDTKKKYKKKRRRKKREDTIFKKIIHSDRGLHLPAYSTNIVSGAFLCCHLMAGGWILCRPIYQKIKFGRFFFYCLNIPWSRKSTLYRRSISYFGWSLFFSSRLLHVCAVVIHPNLVTTLYKIKRRFTWANDTQFLKRQLRRLEHLFADWLKNIF